jgi:hypothetical protein
MNNSDIRSNHPAGHAGEPEFVGAAPPGRAYAWAVSGALLLLLGAAIFLYWPTRAAPARTVAPARIASEAALLGADEMGGSVPVSAITYVSDLDFWQRTPRERTVSAVTHFDLDHDLNDVPLQIGDWQGELRPEQNEEVLILLQPEQYVQRLYRNAEGQAMWLSMVGGRSSQPFHAPDICYDADGWQYNLGSHPVPLAGGGSIYGLYLDAHKQRPDAEQPTEHVVFYFYLFPNDARALSDGIVLFKLTSSRIGTLEETLAIHEDFVRQFFDATAPDV